MEDGAPGADRWFCGPRRNRRAYVVADIAALRDGATVVRAERDADADDPEPYRGPVALKLHTDPAAVDVAQLAARLGRVAAIDHPNLARPIESFLGAGLAHRPEHADTSDDVFYVASRWEDGVALKALAPLPPTDALRVARDVAGAVAALHAAGLTHRDLHPGNVIVRPDGSAAVIDFGTVRPDDDADTATIAGVVGFIAPDVVTGGCRRDADRWAVGMLAVYALLGHPQGSTPTPALRRELEGALRGGSDPRRATAALLTMIDPDPARRPDDAVGCLQRVERHLRRRAWGRPALALAAVALAVVAGSVAWSATRDDATTRRGPLAAAAEPPLVTATAAPPDPVRVAEELTAVPACVVGADFEELGVPDGSCWGGAEQPLLAGTMRPVVDAGGRAAGMVVTAPSGQVTYLTDTMWRSYARIAGRDDAVDSPAYGGYPVGIDRFTDPEAVAIRLDTGGLIIGPRADTQMFWLPAEGVARWNETGGLRGSLGFPASNLKVTLDEAIIEFEHGSLRVAAADVAALQAGHAVPIAVDIPADPSAGLPIGSIRSAIVRQWGGEAWWVDATGVRHWIADDVTLACLGGGAAIHPGADQLAGWTVWLFPLGPPATCPGER